MEKRKKGTCGWLKKQGGVMKTWHRRWFVLNGSVLFYFTRPDETKSQGSYFLDGQRVIVHSPNPDDPDKFTFEIVASKFARPDTESVILCAASDEERKLWVKSLTWALYGGKGGAIFGHSIEDTMKYEHKQFRSIPLLIERCVEYLIKHGLDVEGLFRLPGRTVLIRELKEKFDSADRVSLESLEVDVHTVASLLKHYLRELPESIVPCEFYQKFMNIAMNFQSADADGKNEYVMELQTAMYLLPVDNYNILKYLCKFLKSVTEKSDKNKMTSANIALMFGPNIIRHMDDNPELLLVTADLNQQLVYMMVHYFDAVFMLDYSNRSTVREIPVDDLLGLLDSSTKLAPPMAPDSNPDWADFSYMDCDPDDVFKRDKDSESKRKSLTLPLSTRSSNSNEEDNQLLSPDSDKSATLPRYDDNGKPIPPKRRSKIIRGRRVSERRQNSDSDNSYPSTPDTLYFDPMKAVNIQAYVSELNDKTAELNNHRPVSVTTSSISTVYVNINNASTQTNESSLNGESEMNGKVEPSVPELHLQVSALKDELQRCKTKGDTTIKALKSELTKMKERYEKRIETMQVTHNTQIQTLERKLEEKTLTADDALARVIDLQSQLHDYHMHYGELNNNN